MLPSTLAFCIAAAIWNVQAFENEHFSIEHAIYYRIAGLLFVIPKRSVQALSEMTSSELSLPGPTLAVASEAVESVVKPQKTYCTKFGESDGGVHIHIFPRTENLTLLFNRETHTSGSDDGPRIMSWANNPFIGENEFGDIVGFIRMFKKYFEYNF